MEVYFDNASTTFPKPKIVADSIYNYLVNIGGNANRSNYSNSIESNRELLSCREKIAEFFNYKKSSNIIFTNNITSSLNMLIKGLIKPGDHIISSTMEHNSILRPLMDCKNRLMADFTLLQASDDGYICPKDLINNIKPNTKLVVLSHASNVTGSVQDLKEIGNICHENNIFFIIDSAQSAGTLDVNMETLNASAIAFTGHKSLLGPQGIGGFIISDKLNDNCINIFSGGTGSLSHSLIQPDFLPDKFECGTLNMPGIIGLSNAIDFINSEGLNTISEKVSYLRSSLYNGLKNINNVIVYGGTSNKPTTSCLSINYKNIDPSEFCYYLDTNGIKTRSGLHCAPLAHKSINTYPYGTIRLSLSYYNNIDEVNYVLSIINKFKK
ncbi:MAG: aminotransferase class V-fold PLP-dependent enzyme [Clostridiales bacterium]|nr:aminotransferase class V-fold PLP-dependent enzyme [Clostridiales bacterium]